MTINLSWWMIVIALNLLAITVCRMWPCTNSGGMYDFGLDELIHDVVAVSICAVTWIVALVIRLNFG